jgi:hypothetical protein
MEIETLLAVSCSSIQAMLAVVSESQANGETLPWACYAYVLVLVIAVVAGIVIGSKWQKARGDADTEQLYRQSMQGAYEQGRNDGGKDATEEHKGNYNKGFGVGVQQGSRQGYTKGYKEGYETGYRDGFQAGRNG